MQTFKLGGFFSVFMGREELIKKAFQRGHLLTLKNKSYKEWVESFIENQLNADAKEDITTNSVIKNNKRVKAVVKAREMGIIAGLDEVILLYKKYGIKATQAVKDGQKIHSGEIILKLEGKSKDLLKIERVALDIIQRMSGIATLTNKMKDFVGDRMLIACTRKVPWRYLDKKAVYLGGGLTHRLGLWESILIKDNHLNALKIEGIKNPLKVAVERALLNKRKSIFIEVEVINVREALKIASLLKNINKDIPFALMLDNMQPREISKVVQKLRKSNLYDKIIIEASGGIKPENIRNYAKTGADFLSMGHLTHSSKALNLKQEIL